MPTNFKTYEAQARLVAAIVAANPQLKLDYKEIHKYYGESTPDGLQFQFRAVRKDAESLRRAADAGENPASVNLSTSLGGGSSVSAPSTPSRRKRAPAVPKTPGSGRGKWKTPAATPTKTWAGVDAGEEEQEDRDADVMTLTRAKKARLGGAKKTGAVVGVSGGGAVGGASPAVGGPVDPVPAGPDGPYDGDIWIKTEVGVECDDDAWLALGSPRGVGLDMTRDDMDDNGEV